jgi:hypothetical protein
MTPKPKPPASGCVSDREAMRSLSDAQAGRVDLRARAATVRALLRLRRPAHASGRASVWERRTYRVVARLVSVQRHGSELELTVADPRTGATLVAGLPAAGCASGASPAVRSQIAGARQSLVRRCGLSAESGRVALHGTATLVGVGFFGSRMGARLELRPLLRFAAAACA